MSLFGGTIVLHSTERTNIFKAFIIGQSFNVFKEAYEYGYYWASEPNSYEIDRAKIFPFASWGTTDLEKYDRYIGRTVRLVMYCE